jgi:hypothetical protein
MLVHIAAGGGVVTQTCLIICVQPVQSFVPNLTCAIPVHYREKTTQSSLAHSTAIDRERRAISLLTFVDRQAYVSCGVEIETESGHGRYKSKAWSAGDS